MTAADMNITAARRLLADHAKGRKVAVEDMARVLRAVTDAADWVRASRRTQA